jgi:hypothetical protein
VYRYRQQGLMNMRWFSCSAYIKQAIGRADASRVDRDVIHAVAQPDALGDNVVRVPLAPPRRVQLLLRSHPHEDVVKPDAPQERLHMSQTLRKKQYWCSLKLAVRKVT